MSIQEIYKIYCSFPEISTDSRENQENKIFFALKGDHFDANKFVKDVLDRGAVYAITDDPDYFIDNRTILVKDTLKTLQNLAAFHRQNLKIPFIGITGTNGKTTTKELITSVLRQKYQIVSTSGNLNNHIGVPLTILKIKHDTEIAVIEMGANHPGEIAFLCNIARPDYGIITNIGKAHLEGFGSPEGVIKTKKELFDYILNVKGKIFINADNPVLTSICKSEIIQYGQDKNLFISGSPLEMNPFLRLTWSEKDKTETEEIQTQLIGKYNFENVLCAICVGKYFNLENSIINQAISSYIPSNNRSQIIKNNLNTIIMDAYNANPTSMKEAISSFSQIKTELPKFLILGDMLELGDHRLSEHSKIIQHIIDSGFKKAFFVGPTFSEVNNEPDFKSFNNNDSLIVHLKKNPISGHFILIKGSRGIRLEKILDCLK